MKNIPLSYKEGLLKGLRNDERQGRGFNNLTLCTGLYPDEGALRGIESEEFVDLSSLDCEFPYPQIFELSMFTLVCTSTKIYTYDNVVLTLQLEGLTADTRWTVADFGSYLFMTNGTETVIRNPETGEFQAINSQETPPGQCVCGSPSQIIWGGPDLSMIDIGIMPYSDALPPTPDSFTASQAAGALTLNWTMVGAPTDLKGYIVKYSPNLSGTFEQMLPLHTGVLDKATLSLSPALTLEGFYSFAIVAVDSKDQYSIPRYTETHMIYHDYKALGWPGGLPDCFVNSSGDLENKKSDAWEDHTDWSSWSAWDSGVYGSYITYNGPLYDLGQEVTAHVQGACSASGYSAGGMWFWYSHDGSEGWYANTADILAGTTLTFRYYRVGVQLYKSFTPNLMNCTALSVTVSQV